MSLGVCRERRCSGKEVKKSMTFSILFKVRVRGSDTQHPTPSGRAALLRCLRLGMGNHLLPFFKFYRGSGDILVLRRTLSGRMPSFVSLYSDLTPLIHINTGNYDRLKAV